MAVISFAVLPYARFFFVHSAMNSPKATTQKRTKQAAWIGEGQRDPFTPRPTLSGLYLGRCSLPVMTLQANHTTRNVP
jgi:hypothetical protein